MTAAPSKKALNWENYDSGRYSPGRGSISSSRVRFDSPSPRGTPDLLNIPQQNGDEIPEGDLRHRRSSISMRISSLAHIGGVNSLENFARSWQRAAGFNEIAPVRSSLITSEAEEGYKTFPRADEERGPIQQRSLLRQQLESQGTSPESVVQEDHGTERSEPDIFEESEIPAGSLHGRGNDIFAYAPHLASPFTSDYSGTYSSLSSNINESSKRHAARLFSDQLVAHGSEPNWEGEPLLVRKVTREDGKTVKVVVGQSTLPQTVLNSVNVLIGVGLLSLPLGIRYSGWLVGLAFLLFSAGVTGYTASLLAKCLKLDDTLVTFADLAYISFGSKARLVVSILFTFELVATCVALVILFADSLDVLIPGWGVIEWKVLCGLGMLPLCFVPFHLLSFSSLFGIASFVILVIIDGLLKPNTPGSLWEPATTYLFPQHWSTLPLSFGLLMSTWGGHSVFPNIYKDMRHPYKYNKGLEITYGFTFLLDLTMAVVGLLMFGDGVRDEVTSNILLTQGYPKAISYIIVASIAIIPLTKLPLNTRPIINTIEIACGLDSRVLPGSSGLVGMSSFSRGLLKLLIRVATVIVITVIAILFPSFDRIVALMGSAFCFTICIILPLTFYLKLFAGDLSLKERALDWSLIVVCSIMAVVGTVWAFLPKDKIGAI